MAPAKHKGDVPELENLPNANAIAAGSSSISITSTSSPNALAPANGPTSIPSAQQTGAVRGAAPEPVSNGPGSSSSIKIIGGIVGALVGLLVIFAVTTFYLKRKWKAAAQNNSAQTVFDAKDRHGEEGGEGERTAFISEKPSHTRGASQSSVQTRRSSQDGYLKSGGKRNSLGNHHQPGVEADEPWQLFGGASRPQEVEEAKPLTYHERHLSESGASRPSFGDYPVTSHGRRRSFLEEDSRYPPVGGSADSLGHRQRHSVSHIPTSTFDPFSDASPIASPKVLPRSFTTIAAIETSSPTPGGSPVRGTKALPEGRRVSLKGGVGVRPKAPGSPGGSPRPSWK